MNIIINRTNDDELYEPNIIEPLYEIFDDIKKINNVREYINIAKKYLAENIEYQDRKTCYNLFYFTYLNMDLLNNKYNKLLDTMVERIYTFMTYNDFYELVVFLPHIISYDKLTDEQKMKYKTYLEKYNKNKKPIECNFKFKEKYEQYGDLICDVQNFFHSVNYYPTEEKIKEIFTLFLNNKDIIKKNGSFKKDFEKVYHKTNNNLIRYCYLEL
jgi:hypothetical protein